MISNAFKSAYTNKVGGELQNVSNITSGIKSAATLGLGAAGFSGALGTGLVAKTAKYALAGKVGGIGGAIMLATMEEKKQSAQDQKDIEAMFSKEDVVKTIQSNLGDNPINNAAKKRLSTAFEKLTEAKEKGIINKKGMIETNMGEIDPNSELGKKLVQGEWKNDNDR